MIPVDLIPALLIPASGILCVTAVVAFALTRRYGAGLAALLPLLALVAMAGILWQAEGGAGKDLILFALAASTPVILGALFGIWLARRGRA